MSEAFVEVCVLECAALPELLAAFAAAMAALAAAFARKEVLPDLEVGALLPDAAAPLPLLGMLGLEMFEEVLFVGVLVFGGVSD